MSKAELITWSTFQSQFGTVLLSSSHTGVCCLMIGEERELIEDLQRRFPRARLKKTHHPELIASVEAFFKNPHQKNSIELDMRGTDFQKLVWRTLQEIPCGSTQSYSAIAEKIGSPRATRAVARACASNSIALFIPCHRVLRKDGSLSGYYWGAHLKEKLLQLEGAFH